MFIVNTIRDVEVDEQSPYVRTLIDKLIDIEKHRIHSSDDLVLRKAVFGLLEVLGELERRIIALEGPEAQEQWRGRLVDLQGQMSPDEVRLGERDEADDSHHAQLTYIKHEGR